MVKRQQRQFVKFVAQQCSKSEVIKPNFDKVFKTFKRNYTLVPLEVFADNPYKTLISTLLSSRTKDEVTKKSSDRFFAKFPSLEKLNKIKLTDSKIEKLIYPVGFYKTKAKYIKQISKMRLSKIPQKRNDLMKLPGVGRKTANLVLNRAFNIPAIAVDTHVHRISNKLGWVNTKNPNETESILIKILPQKYWKDINRLFVSIGRKYNTSKKLTKFLKKEGLI